MPCAVYKGSRKPDTYLYVEQKDDFSRLPEALLHMLGKLELVMELDLATRTRLARVSPDEVARHLRENGYFLQMPPSDGHPLDS